MISNRETSTSTITAGPGPVSKRRAERACDSCRAKRLKCDWVGGSGSCDRCIRLSLPCEQLRPPPEDNRQRKKRDRRKAKPQDQRPVRNNGPHHRLDPRFLGSTSVSALIATSHASLTTDLSHDLQGLDELFSHSRIPLSTTGEQVVLVGRGDDGVDSSTDMPTEEGDVDETFVLSLQSDSLATSSASQTVLLVLMQSFARNFLPYCPIISLAELCTLEPALSFAFTRVEVIPTPVGLPQALAQLAVCSIAALSREVPRRIARSLFQALRHRLDGAEGMRLMRRSCVGNVQTLLLLGVSAEVHASSTCEGGSRSWLTLGTALRMALDLGLHRDLAPSGTLPYELNRRRRVWAAVVISDRWYSTSFGQPQGINLFDCDAAGASIYHDTYTGILNNGDTPYALHAETHKISVLLGRVVRYAYSPFGMDMNTNTTLCAFQDDLDHWRTDLSGSLVFDASAPTQEAGLLHLLSSCVEFAFLSAFMRPKRPIPARITFRPDAAAWTNMIARSAQAIHWTATNGLFLMDTWFVVMYSLTWCFFAQLQEYTYTRAPAALHSMREADRCFQDWAAGEKGEQGWQKMLRTKVSASVTCLLKDAERMSHEAPGHSTTVPDITSTSFPSSETAYAAELWNSLPGLDLFANSDWSLFNDLVPNIESDWGHPQVVSDSPSLQGPALDPAWFETSLREMTGNTDDPFVI